VGEWMTEIEFLECGNHTPKEGPAFCHRADPPWASVITQYP